MSIEQSNNIPRTRESLRLDTMRFCFTLIIIIIEYSFLIEYFLSFVLLLSTLFAFSCPPALVSSFSNSLYFFFEQLLNSWVCVAHLAKKSSRFVFHQPLVLVYWSSWGRRKMFVRRWGLASRATDRIEYTHSRRREFDRGAASRLY